MIAKFGSVQALQEALDTTKFSAVAIPYSWTFGGKVRVDPNKPTELIVGEKTYQVIARLEDMGLAIIAVPGV